MNYEKHENDIKQIEFKNYDITVIMNTCILKEKISLSKQLHKPNQVNLVK